MRRPLSRVPEEAAFLRADERCDALCSLLSRNVRARFAAQGASLDRRRLAMATQYGPTWMRGAVNRWQMASEWSAAMQHVEPVPVAKARRRPANATDAELIDQAVETGLDLALDTLPARVRDEVSDTDLEAARRLTRQRLQRGMFRQSLAALKETQRGLIVLLEAGKSPTLPMLRDVERLASMFGLNARQAQAIVNEAEAMARNKVKPAVIVRQMTRRVEQALEARAEMIAQTLGREAINTAQQALYEVLDREDLLGDRQVREWVTRHDERVCERCDAFDGERAPLDDSFVSELGEIAFQTGIHPSCRCRIRLVTVRDKKRGRRAA